MADIHQPHDGLFRSVFSDAGDAASLLQAALPDTVRNTFDWTTLTLVDGTFVDEDLQESQSDLFYQVEHAPTGQPVSMYILFEHQWSPDPWMRLLRYCCRIWEADRRDDPDRRELRPIVPVVFYQGARGWIHKNLRGTVGFSRQRDRRQSEAARRRFRLPIPHRPWQTLSRRPTSSTTPQTTS